MRVSRVSFVRRVSFATFGRMVRLGSYVRLRRLVGIEVGMLTTSSDCAGGVGLGDFAGCFFGCGI